MNRLLDRIINNHIRDKAIALFEGNIDLASHINKQYHRYVGYAAKVQGRRMADEYDNRREQYIRVALEKSPMHNYYVV